MGMGWGESQNTNSGPIPKPIYSLSVQIHNLCYPNFMVHDVKKSKRIFWPQLPPHKILVILLSHRGRCPKETMARQPQMQECDTVFSRRQCGPGEWGVCVGTGGIFRSLDEEAALWTWIRYFLYWTFVYCVIACIYKILWIYNLDMGETSRWNNLERRDIESFAWFSIYRKCSFSFQIMLWRVLQE